MIYLYFNYGDFFFRFIVKIFVNCIYVIYNNMLCRFYLMFCILNQNFFFFWKIVVIFDNLRFDKKLYIYIYVIGILFEYICIVYKNGEDLNRLYNLCYKI